MSFISIDGGEGVGKTTQMKLLKERLPILFKSKEILFTREPGGTPFSEHIRELILSDEAKDADGKTMFGLFAAARAVHLREIIVPALLARKIVITDRFAAATYAYQVVAQNNPISQEFFTEYYLKSLDRIPHLTIILDGDPEVAQDRIKSRNEQGTTHFDARPLEFHKKLRDGYLHFRRRYSSPGHRVEVVDADRSVAEVHQDIFRHIRRELSER